MGKKLSPLVHILVPAYKLGVQVKNHVEMIIIRKNKNKKKKKENII